jgi:hypothetical protein
MKIFFAGAIRGGREDREIYVKLINYLKNFGEVLTEHVGAENLPSEEQHLTDEYLHETDVQWLKNADLLVAEVSNPSLGVGYQIGVADVMSKKILCLYRNSAEKRLSAMIAGNKKLKLAYYDQIEQAYDAMDDFFGTI